jgi:hypothetical protein
MEKKTFYTILLGIFILGVVVMFSLPHETITITEIPARTLPGIIVP